MAAVSPPPTPVLLYLGAGYDLSPLLSFAPDPPYEIAPRLTTRTFTTPHTTTYTSFLFADAKPRHTSAFMVPDFDEWTDVPARVRNVVRYAQGMLDRWRLVDTDVIWFEGRGSPSQIASRRADTAWHFVPRPTSALPSHPYRDHSPLITLLYAFNTLDIELARMSTLANVWPHVTALYVHGLRPHTVTGLDRLIGGEAEEGVGEPTLVLPVVNGSTALRTYGIQHVYVLVGSWGTPHRGRARKASGQQGVRDVDFVRAGWRQWKKRAGEDRTPQAKTTSQCDLLHLHVPNSQSGLTSDADSDLGTPSPVVFRRARPAWWDTDAEEWSSCDSDDDDGDGRLGHTSSTPGLTAASSPYTPPSSCSLTPPRFSTFHIAPARESRPIHAPFHTRIPQIAWDDALNDGRGGYYVSKTVEESLAVWRARGNSPLDTEEEDSAPEGDDSQLEGPADEINNALTHSNPRPFPHPTLRDTSSDHSRRPRTAPPHLRLRPRNAHTTRPISASASTSTPARPPSFSGSASDTDVSDGPRLRWPFWRRGMSISTPPRHSQHERRMNLSDFLRSPTSPSPAPPPRPPSHRRRTHSCPDLKSSTRDIPLSRRSFPALRAFTSIGRKAGNRDNTATRRGSSLPRFRFGGLSTPPPAPPLPTSAPSTPPSPSAQYRLSRSKPRSKTKTKMRRPREEFEWLGRLIGQRRLDRTGVDSCESDVTRVGDC